MLAGWRQQHRMANGYFGRHCNPSRPRVDQTHGERSRLAGHRQDIAALFLSRFCNGLGWAWELPKGKLELVVAGGMASH
jgi:hypothetical protein